MVIEVKKIKDNDVEVLADEYGKAGKLAKSLEAQITEVTKTLQSQLMQVKEREGQLRDAIYDAMLENDVKKFENEFVAFTRVEPTTRTTLDAKALEAEFPDVAAKFKKTSQVAGSVRIKVK